MDKQNEPIEAFTLDTGKLRCSGKSLKLKASEKAAKDLCNTCLVGKLLADRIIKKNVVKAIILKAWRTEKGIQIVDLKENVFFVQICL